MDYINSLNFTPSDYILMAKITALGILFLVFKIKACGFCLIEDTLFALFLGPLFTILIVILKKKVLLLERYSNNEITLLQFQDGLLHFLSYDMITAVLIMVILGLSLLSISNTGQSNFPQD